VHDEHHDDDRARSPGERGIARRTLLIGGGAAVAAFAGGTYVFWDKIKRRLDVWTRKDSFAATPPLVPHDPARDRATIYVGRDGGPAGNVDTVLAKLGGIGTIVGADDLVIIKVSAQWWNTGMTNAGAVKRTIDHILDLPGFKGEVVVFENTHFRFPDRAHADPAAGLTRAWTFESSWNVDLPGRDRGRLLDLAELFPGKPVSFVGLVDGGGSDLSGDPWYDPEHRHGTYGGDGRGPIGGNEPRDGYHWDFGQTFRLARSRVMDAQTPLTWPRFTSPRSGEVIDLRDGVLRRDGDRLVATGRPIKFINMTTCNEHGSTGITAACKSPMGLVDMSAGALGNHPRVRGYQSIHYFGRLPEVRGDRSPTWRMAGPLAFFGERVRRADLYLTVAEWVAITPDSGYDDTAEDMRQARSCAVKAGTIVAGVDPVAIDAYCAREILHPRAARYKAMLDVGDPDSKTSRFLRYFRQTAGWGTLDPALVTVV
jgi:hypothetical protein